MYIPEEENQKLRDMMAALSAGQGFDAQTFENLGRKRRPRCSIESLKHLKAKTSNP